MKKYVGTKMLQGEPMNLGDYNNYRGWTIPENEDPKREGYLVIYEDGYKSWSPKEVFEEAYKDCAGMTFGIALELAKKGFKIAREGWNGKGMFVYYVPENSYPSNTGIAKEQFGVMVDYNPYLAIVNVNRTVSTWVPSVNDCLAEDWVIVE